ncbi:MAG: LPS assembly protein LptD [Candidatus Zixiibacteriota bacterium]|nr:MAG: LPS assembly protein LptD [candidate division Zixibacteria bacterium]
MANKILLVGLGLVGLLVTVAPAQEREIRDLILHYADRMEMVPRAGEQIWYVLGSVVFESEGGMVYCDSAVWVKGSEVDLLGSVVIDDTDFRLVADSVHYDLITNEALALGSYVELYSRKDSLFAVGTHAFLDRNTDYLFMKDRPTLLLQYPDTGRMIEVLADFIHYDGNAGRAEATGDVKIASRDLSSSSGCAVLYPRRQVLDLFDLPVARRGKSEVSGQLITILSNGGELESIDVIDSALAEFTEPHDSMGVAFDRSILRGERIIFQFEEGELAQIKCWGQAYSWYYPSDVGKMKSEENTVSGDTITFDVEAEELQRVNVIGGAIGTYLGRNYRVVDSIPDSTGDSLVFYSGIDTVTDTIDYNAHRITYDLVDSMIILTKQAHLASGDVSLEAHLVDIDTKTDVVHAFSADVRYDSLSADSSLTSGLQPNPIPVVLQDGEDVLLGDYLEYSIDTEKGRIVQSKSRYQTGFFYGDKLYREQKKVFYLSEGRYTTCDAAEPHFHFHSNNLKLVEGEKLIAKPVVLNIGRLPILAVPYYIFPLERGRHSGWLPFTFGNIERGDRYIRNVGYYWAASEYWDWKGALDYYERSSRLNFFSSITYNKRYVFSGSIGGNYSKQTSYSYSSASESKSTRWSMKASHSHQFAPSFKVDASGQIQSDKTYFQDFSADLQDRLNRVVRSQITFSKRFSRTISVSGKVAHDENLDLESRSDLLPSLGISLPQIRPFGSGSRNDQGTLESKWYQNLVVTYRPALVNSSSRQTITTTDSFGQDSTKYRSRKKFARINHSLSATFPTKIARYIVLSPSLSYREEWFRIFKTDQSDSADLDPGNYRTYVYSTGATMKTDIYGTVYPNIPPLIGLRQTLTPSISYSYTPEINRHPEVRRFAGGLAGSTGRSQSLSFRLGQTYQAKVKSGEIERNLTLFTLSSGFSYDLEKDIRPFSPLTTTINSTLLPKVNFYGNMKHSLYKPESDELSFWSPYLESFSLNASFTLSGGAFLFDDLDAPLGRPDTTGLPTGTASPPIPGVIPGAISGGLSQPGGWSLTANYSYTESGRGAAYRKSSFLRFSLRFNLTPQTSVSYSQYYNITEGKTVNNQVNIVRKLHCWTGNLFWVPIGSNRGWGFKLYVNALPQIKIDQSQNQLGSGYLAGQR